MACWHIAGVTCPECSTPDNYPWSRHRPLYHITTMPVSNDYWLDKPKFCPADQHCHCIPITQTTNEAWAKKPHEACCMCRHVRAVKAIPTGVEAPTCPDCGEEGCDKWDGPDLTPFRDSGLLPS